jgi:hypothetical protein
MTEWIKGNELEIRKAGGDLGGTMRLGALQGGAEGRQQDRRYLWRIPAFRSATATATK